MKTSLEVLRGQCVASAQVASECTVADFLKTQNLHECLNSTLFFASCAAGEQLEDVTVLHCLQRWPASSECSSAVQNAFAPPPAPTSAPTTAPTTTP